MTNNLTPKQQELSNYLITKGFDNVNTEDIQKLISGMTAQALTEALEDAQTRLQLIKSTTLGRELI